MFHSRLVDPKLQHKFWVGWIGSKIILRSNISIVHRTLYSTGSEIFNLQFIGYDNFSLLVVTVGRINILILALKYLIHILIGHNNFCLTVLTPRRYSSIQNIAYNHACFFRRTECNQARLYTCAKLGKILQYPVVPVNIYYMFQKLVK